MLIAESERAWNASGAGVSQVQISSHARAPEAEKHLELAASGIYVFLSVLLLFSFLLAEYFLIGFAHRTPLFPVLHYLFTYK